MSTTITSLITRLIDPKLLLSLSIGTTMLFIVSALNSANYAIYIGYFALAVAIASLSRLIVLIQGRAVMKGNIRDSMLLLLAGVIPLGVLHTLA